MDGNAPADIWTGAGTRACVTGGVTRLLVPHNTKTAVDWRGACTSRKSTGPIRRWRAAHLHWRAAREAACRPRDKAKVGASAC